MKRELEIFDKTNGIRMEVEFNDADEYFELWGMDIKKEPVVVLERKKYNIRPYAIYPRLKE